MIQDIAPHNLFNQYNPQVKAQGQDCALHFDGNKVCLKGGEIPKVSDFEGSEFTYLLRVDEMKFFLAVGSVNLSHDMKWEEVFALRRQSSLPQHLIFAIMTGKHLADWYRDTAFCGRCGSHTVHSETERARVCPKCSYTAYPRIMPAVIVGVRNGDELLLTQYRTGYGHNALIAGFTEIGETLEQTVSREVMEEAGIKVKNIRYYKSQPWGVANDILAGFYCDVDGDTEIHMDENELKIAHWVKREDIVLQPDNFSLTNEMMSMFKEGKM